MIKAGDDLFLIVSILLAQEAAVDHINSYYYDFHKVKGCFDDFFDKVGIYHKLTCSDEVQPFTTSFFASQQLQTDANIQPTEIPLHSLSSGENPPFIRQKTVDQKRFPLVSDKEISIMYEKE